MPAEKLASGDILIAEFNYLAQTAAQANEDRARASSFYLATFGSVIAALLAVANQLSSASTSLGLLNAGFSALFGLLGLMGLSALFKLARLRLAWLNSVHAMNAIKEHYAAHFDALADAFAFNNLSLPPRLLWKSFGGLMALEVALTGAFNIALACFFALMALGGPAWFVPSLLAGLLFLALELGLYAVLLR